MLVLSRKANEKIRIGDDITITILRVKGKAVRVGIEAPGAVPVLRGELTFEPREERSAEGEPAASDDAPAPMVGLKPAAPKAASTRSDAWPVQGAANVAYARVSRSRVATVLPQMLGEAGPLRAMLDRRTAAGEF